MKNQGRKILEEAFIAYYCMTSSDYLLALLQENGFTHQRLITDIQTTPNQSDEAKGLDI